MRETFAADFDVIVAGAGVAGVAAALAAARAGSRTALVEKTVFPGGLATAGNVLAYLPLSDSRGQQVTFGIAEQLLRAALRYGPGDIPPDWRDPQTRSRFGSRFSPASLVLALDEELTGAGVEIWYDTLICQTVVQGDRVTGIEVENKSGRGRLSARCLVDATGDADVAFRAGAACVEQDNYLSLWALGASLDRAGRAAGSGDGSLLLELVTVGGSDVGAGHPEGMRKFSGTRGKDVSRFALEGRRLLREHYRKKQQELGETGRKDTYPLSLPAMVDVRTTRRIEGRRCLKDGEMYQHFDDCVGLVADWRGGRDVWEVPFGALLPAQVRGLLAAGRCIASAGQAWEVTRVIQAAAMTGEVSGTAAAMAAQLDTTPDALDVTDLQNQLKGRGFRLDVGEIEAA
ncbi:MAG: FAD-dependent oxidoreductase [Candidatus Latescibacteria bacterium]|nr:hypothetical protein [Gemmatimonadaceae bacterium]MDP6014622.1 FAD-dependent oxidoreductase [Candidatus Latescibacterota bacterium]MDP7447930.1 FAD-dependent oxidoreductase [Candidatus Latescibacterota bacterium]HJP30132.1 FAD-dependent oxidoreductase [Candidatus Latescibacterota bacterium]|tara:strand:- start:998 stop:2203 length:1206 start_codon:yes stop_codon:yes gene_type:complete